MRSVLLGAALAASLPAVALSAVRVAHLSPDTPAVNVRFGPAGGPLATIITGLEYGSLAPASGYLPVPTGSYDARVDAPSLGAAGTGAISVDGLALDGNTNYTIAAVGTLAALLDSSLTPATAPLQPRVYVDDLTSVPGQARVRFIHASANTPAVDIVLDSNGVNEPTDPVIFGNVARFDSGGYLTLAPGSYQLDAYLNDRNVLSTPALDNLLLNLEAGFVYTVWAVGLNSLVGQQPGQGQALGVVVTVDAVPAPGFAGLLAAGGLLAARRRRR